MLLRRFREFAILLLLLLLAACGGDDDGVFSPGGDKNPDAVVTGNVQLLTSTPRIGSGTKGATLTALVKDKNGILLEDVPVTFSSNNNGTLQVIRGTTNESGSAEALLTSPGDFRNRILTVTATAGASSTSLNIEVAGTTLTVAGPKSVPLGDQVQYTLSLKDADSSGIFNETVSVSSARNSISSSSLTTDKSGDVYITLDASTGGLDTLSASALSNSISTALEVDVSADSFTFVAPSANEIDLNTVTPVTIEWMVDGNPVADGEAVSFSTTRGVLSSFTANTTGGSASVSIQANNAGAAIITATAPGGLSTQRSIEFVATVPHTIVAKSEKSQLGIGEQTEITAVVRDPSNNLVKNQTVSFQLTDTSGGTISTGESITNSQGVARTVYTAGSSTSAIDGVEIRTSVKSNDTIRDTVYLTVAQSSSRISLGTGNEIEEPTTTTYIHPFVVFVTDATGAPIVNTDVELSLIPTGYRKGRYDPTDLEPKDGTLDVWRPTYSASCGSEDVNKNGILDAGEDFNSNGTLEPTTPGSVPGSVTTGADGSAHFGLSYPQSHCSWTEVKLQAKVRVDGTENSSSETFVLSCLASDLNDLEISPPGGRDSLYGTAASCGDPN